MALPILLTVLASATNAPHEQIVALDPFEVFADGLGDLQGIAVDAHGDVFVADRVTGMVVRIAPDRSHAVVASHLARPVGLAFDPRGRLLIAEEKAGRVVRVETNGRPTTLVAGIKQPRWLAVGEDGTLFVSARGLTREADPEPEDDSAEPEMILALRTNGTLDAFADGFRDLQGLAASHAALFAATRGSGDERPADGVVYEIPIRSDGRAAPRRPIGTSDRYEKPVGLTRDALGALYLATKEPDLIAKLDPNGGVTHYAENLRDPQGLALDANGDLYVADGGSGRVLRFRAPRAPALTAADFTNRSPLPLSGMATPGARVDLFVNDAAIPITATADAAGGFAAAIDLIPNASNALAVFVTSRGGQGLTSAPTDVAIVHDDIAPGLSLQALPAHVRGNVGVRAQASDAGTGVQTLTLAVDGQIVSATVTPRLPAASATATAMWNTRSVADGAHLLGATATDRATNRATATRIVLVDNTPPDTEIIAGPVGTIAATSPSFVFTGTDNLTPMANLVFAWRLDGGSWSDFGATRTVGVSGLAPGPHTFEVKARDLAGNEDPTPAQRAFTLGSLLQVSITSPTGGATVPAGSLLVQGTVTAPDGEIGLTVNGVVAAIRSGVFAALVPVTVGPFELVAVATTPGGTRADYRVTVTVTGAEAGLAALPQSGLAPLTVSFRLTADPGTTITLDADGDGTIDVMAPVLDGQTFTFTRPGLYFPVATLSDGRGNHTTARTAVQVYDPVGLDAFFKAKWSAMKSALIANDVDGATAQFLAAQQDRYRTLFTALSADIAQIARDMQDIELVYVVEGRAKYRLPRAQVWGGQLTTLTYYVYFVQDGDGLWTLESF